MLEYSGSAVAALSVDERATLTNMAAEVGAFSALVPPDAQTTPTFSSASAGSMQAAPPPSWPGSSPIRMRTSRRPSRSTARKSVRSVALPGDPGNGIAVADLGASIKIDIAYAGSCTAGKKSDLDMYAAVFAEAAARGDRVAPHVRCYIQVGSQEVRRHAERRGYLEIFERVGAILLEPGCGACINAGPGVSFDRETVTVSAINRNFPGRSGPGKVYLASPYTVAASALAGWITVWDPYPAGTDAA